MERDEEIQFLERVIELLKSNKRPGTFIIGGEYIAHSIGVTFEEMYSRGTLVPYNGGRWEAELIINFSGKEGGTFVTGKTS